jgi:hypothetical protein
LLQDKTFSLDIASQITNLKSTLPEGVRLVAVSKTQPPEQIMEAYRAGHRIFGENKAQEMVAKQAQLPDDIEWHFIGHLQTNKVAMIAPVVHMVHSIDSLKLLRIMNREAEKSARIIRCLLQFHIATEESKFGLDMDEARMILTAPEYTLFNNIRISGVMGMATFTEDQALVRKEFRTLRIYFETLKQEFFQQDPEFGECSMGMTGDYRIAIEEGATIIRIGSLIFGERNY